MAADGASCNSCKVLSASSAVKVRRGNDVDKLTSDPKCLKFKGRFVGKKKKNHQSLINFVFSSI